MCLQLLSLDIEKCFAREPRNDKARCGLKMMTSRLAEQSLGPKAILYTLRGFISFYAYEKKQVEAIEKCFMVAVSLF
jgi:hypothetical protein